MTPQPTSVRDRAAGPAEERLQLLIDACHGIQNDRLRSFIDQGGIGKVLEKMAAPAPSDLAIQLIDNWIWNIEQGTETTSLGGHRVGLMRIRDALTSASAPSRDEEVERLRGALNKASQFFYSHSKNSRYAEKLYTEICAALSPPLSTTGACDGSR